MTLYNELLYVAVGIVLGLLIGFVGRCYQEYVTRCRFELVFLSGVSILKVFMWLFFLPLKVLFSEKVRKDILRVLIRGAEKSHQSEGHHEVLVDTLANMSGRYYFFKFSFSLALAGLQNCKILTDMVLKTVYEIVDTRQKISSEKVEHRIATKNEISIYRNYYPALSLPLL